MKVFKNMTSARFANDERISDRVLCEAVERAERGLVDANLGGGVIKQRIARPDAGRSGGLRTLILFRVGERAIFAFGFAKSEMDNIGDRSLKALKLLAATLLGHTDEETQVLVDEGVLVEVDCDEENLQR